MKLLADCLKVYLEATQKEDTLEKKSRVYIERSKECRKKEAQKK
jgi:hypothetical protein